MEVFYVTITSGGPPSTTSGNVAFALGPCATKEEAEGRVPEVKAHCRERYERSHWWAYGVTRVVPGEGRTPPVGRLNGVLGYTPSTTYPTH